MKNKLVTVAAKVVSVFPFSRKIGASAITLAVKLRGGKTLGVYSEFRQREVQLQGMIDYHHWYRHNVPSYTELEEQKESAKNFANQPKISVLVPTYNTDPQFLRECIESVIAQTYFNWELCLADDASPNQDVAKIIKEYAEADPRIVYKIRTKNGHICAATNTALKLATGEYVSLLDHDDILWPNALYEVVKMINKNPKAELIYTDEDKLEQDGFTHSEPFFKPDWSPDYLRTINYITHFATLKKTLIDEIKGFRLGTHGAQDWDLFLRATSATKHIYHIPTIVYSWRKSPTSTALSTDAKDYAYINQKKVLEDDIARRELKGRAVETQYKGYWRLKYDITKNPKVSIIIPTKNQLKYLKLCLESIKAKTTYSNYEIVLVDTGSDDKLIWQFYDQAKVEHSNLKVVKWQGAKFNFSAACNMGAKRSKGEYLLFLNNDTEVITEDWIESLLEHAQREQVGAVGAKLLYADNTIQHAGIILGMSSDTTIKGVAGHVFSAWDDDSTYHIKALTADSVRNYSAVTAACLMVSKAKFNEVEGFDEGFKIAFNDVDFCLKLRKRGYFNVYSPHAKLYHFESKSVGKFATKHRDTKQFQQETAAMGKRWGWRLLTHDPYYNPNLSLLQPYGNTDPDYVHPKIK